ncbi:MAG: glycoside hydrolase family 3 protein [Lachnospiraceae bacterium]|jgi:beta-glucosidase|nr:glycoside hydrolase family 3 protein [Lachnospiraceae bacterium]
MNKEFKKIAEELVDKMTLEEAAGQIRYDSPAIERLNIPSYNWWGEGLHGLARAGTSTVFPQSIALAAMFDKDTLYRIGQVISTEARAKYNESRKRDDRDLYKNITMWSPNINIFRDARWGRGQETYGEDPYLTARLGVAFIKGLQGEGHYIKTAACAKHFAAHSGPEATRHGFNAVASKKDIEETYIPAFKAAVTEADVCGVMGAYNRLNGEPTCASSFLMDTLKNKWHFDGYFVSDFLALMDFHEAHKVTNNVEETVAMALKAGCDVNAGYAYRSVMSAYEQGLITEEEIRNAAKNAYKVRAALGMFEESTEYDSLGVLDIDTDESAKLSYEASTKSVVMLKNDGVLPLDRSKVKTIGVIGPTATSVKVLEGNYNGLSSRYITNLDGIRQAAGNDIRVLYSEGAHLFEDRVQPLALPDDRLSEAEAVAQASDVVILCVGLDTSIEGEEGDTGNAFAAGDKTSLFLPESQQKLVRVVAKCGKPVVVVCNTGSAIDFSFEEEHFNAILQCWYSGQHGGKAVADMLFGDVCPSGKLPVTFYYDDTQPPMEDYSMKGRTYRYIKGEPLYPFGYGLSYTDFEYSKLCVSEDGHSITINVKNTGQFDADEVVELYVDKQPAEKLDNGNNNIADLNKLLIPDNQPHFSLCGFERVSVGAGKEVTVNIPVPDEAYETVLEDGQRVTLKGTYTFYVGGTQPDSRSTTLTGKTSLVCEFIKENF